MPPTSTEARRQTTMPAQPLIFGKPPTDIRQSTADESKNRIPRQCLKCPLIIVFCVYVDTAGGRDTKLPGVSALWAVRFRTGWPKDADLCGGGRVMKHKLERV